MKVGYLDSIIQRIPIRKPCKGYYLRWYYNGWHYWFFLPGEMNMETVGEAYRTIGTRKISIGSGQLTYPQAQAIRTILLTREIYLLTADGWKNIRVEPSSVITLENMVNGYEMEFVMIIGSKEISYETGYTPIPIIPVVDPIPDPGACEVIIGTQVWACKNYDSNYPGSRVYVDDEYFRDLFGGLYTYNQVMASGFVPPGWHVPTIAEWQTLIAFVGGSGVAGGKLKEAGFSRWLFPNTGAVDTYGFSAVGGGRYNSITKVYELIGYEGWLWTSDELPSGYANAVIMTNTNDNAYPIGQLMNNYISVRLIKDTPAGDFDDWYLPELDLLDFIYSNLYVHAVGNIQAANYWSSSEVSATNSWVVVMHIGGIHSSQPKANLWYVRPVRHFTAGVGSYALRDIGPSGGWIFHIVGTTYYEAGPVDLTRLPGFQNQWSNIQALAVGGTGTAVGTGLANNQLMIAQPGHIWSTAKTCLDYEL